MPSHSLPRGVAPWALAGALCACTAPGDHRVDTADEATVGDPDGGAQSGAGGVGASPPSPGAGGGGGGANAGGAGAGGGPSSEGPDPGCDGYPFAAEALYAERIGFGAGTQGGDPARPYHVTSLAGSGPGTLAAALESSEPYWIVFDVEGKITLPGGSVDIASHKTIDGRGRDITIEGTLRIRHQQNIIVSDVRLTNTLEGHCTQAGDVISVTGNGTTPASYTARRLWFHHLELFDGGDGLLDLRAASDVTVSWTHLHTHKKAMLMGKNADGSPSTGMRVTLHHNFFDRITLRGPQFLQGLAHFFNNYQLEWYEYGAGGLGGAQFLSENNVYQARPGTYCFQSCPDENPCGDNDFVVSKRALVHAWSSSGDGSVRSIGDLALEGAVLEQNAPSAVFEPSAHYDYVAEPASEALAAAVAEGAGPRVSYCR